MQIKSKPLSSEMLLSAIKQRNAGLCGALDKA
jgi:hypothetical protein